MIIISSTKNITVTHGLSGVDNTNPAVVTGNNLNISSLWTKNSVDIKEGQHSYPAEIAEWPTVKMLEEQKIITIGKEIDEAQADAIDASNAKSFEAENATVDAASNIDKPSKRKSKKDDASAESVAD